MHVRGCKHLVICGYVFVMCAEPSSGLDSSTALLIVKLLKDMVAEGRTGKQKGRNACCALISASHGFTLLVLVLSDWCNNASCVYYSFALSQDFWAVRSSAAADQRSHYVSIANAVPAKMERAIDWKLMMSCCVRVHSVFGSSRRHGVLLYSTGVWLLASGQPCWLCT